MRRICAGGLALIKRYEGLRLEAYRCSAGVWTVGYGHTGPDVTPERRVTEAEAEALLLSDLADAERAVDDLVQVPVDDNEHAALVSLVFNIGRDAFKNSTLLRLLNLEDRVGAAFQFHRWCKASGKPVKGLVARRIAEADLFRMDVA